VKERHQRLEREWEDNIEQSVNWKMEFFIVCRSSNNDKSRKRDTARCMTMDVCGYSVDLEFSGVGM